MTSSEISSSMRTVSYLGVGGKSVCRRIFMLEDYEFPDGEIERQKLTPNESNLFHSRYRYRWRSYEKQQAANEIRYKRLTLTQPY